MEYTVKLEGFILGTFRSEGAPVTLTSAQARTFLQEGRIAPKSKDATPTASVRANQKKPKAD